MSCISSTSALKHVRLPRTRVPANDSPWHNKFPHKDTACSPRPPGNRDGKMQKVGAICPILYDGGKQCLVPENSSAIKHPFQIRVIWENHKYEKRRFVQVRPRSQLKYSPCAQWTTEKAVICWHGCKKMSLVPSQKWSFACEAYSL